MNICGRDKLWEITHVHLPGSPSFRTKRQFDSYCKKNGLTQTDTKTIKDMAAKMNYKTPHDLKKWWSKSAEKFSGIVNKPALRTSG